jgi:hypothetical protein
MNSAPSPTTDTRLRRFHPTPARLLVILLAVEGILFLSKPWFPKGCAVLDAIAAVGFTMVLMLVWLVLAVVFHWRFQFSLRSLMVATVAVAIPFSWLAVEMKKAREQREAVEALVKQGGFVGYDYEVNHDGLRLRGATSGVPVRLQSLLGDDFFRTVTRALSIIRRATGWNSSGWDCLRMLNQS